MAEQRIRSFRLNLDREIAREGRSPAEHMLLAAGCYRIDQDAAEGGYNPFSSADMGRSPHWFHELHLAIVPLGGASRAAPTIRHLTIRNRADPGPHPDMLTTRAAFRAIPPAERSFALAERSSVVWWIQAGEYGEWEKGRFCYGTLQLTLFQVEP